MKRLLHLLIAPLSIIMVPGLISLGVSFDTLGDLPGGPFTSDARGVSEDGMIVVGRSSSSWHNLQLEAFKWKFGTMKGLGFYDDQSERSYAEAISSDGTTIVGGGDAATGTHAMIWTIWGMDALDDLPFSLATCVSPDGTIIGGYSQTARGAEAFFLERGSVMHIGTASDDNLINSAVNAISPDGLIMVGKQYIEYNYHYAVYWDWVNHPSILQYKLDSPAEAFGISADKSIAVGHERNMAVYWPVEIGGRYTWLPEPNFNSPSEARDVSGDGSLIVGWRSNPVLDPDNGGSQAMLWWRTLIGSEWTYVAEILNDYLDSNGVDREGFHCNVIYDVTDDGRTVVGTGTNSDGSMEAFRVRLGPTGMAGYPLSGTGTTMQTGVFLGILDVGLAPWVWCFNAGHWFYLSEPVAEAGRGWIYVANINTLSVRMLNIDHIGYSLDMDKWLYLNPAVMAAGHGWVFIL